MRIIFLGAPGSGKGTQGEKLHKELNYQVLTTSNILRAHLQSDGPLGKKIQEDMQAGKLVSDDLVWQVMSAAIVENEKSGKGLVLDGYPRSLAQLDFLNQGSFEYNYMVYFKVDESIVVDRVCGRRVHMSSGRVYHIKYAPPKVEGKDDVTGEPLVHRKDDQEDVVKTRLLTYQEKTMPILDRVQQDIDQQRGKVMALVTIDASQEIHVITEQIKRLIGK